MRLKKFFLIGSLALLYACVEKSNEYILSFHDYKLKPFDFEVFPKDFKPYALKKSDLSKCDVLIKNSIDSFVTRTKVAIDLSKYGKQYLAARGQNNQVFVYVNFFCRPDRFDYKQQYLVVASDGGACYFQLMINLSEEIVSKFSVNGDG